MFLLICDMLKRFAYSYGVLLGATWYILVFGQALGGMPSFPKVPHGLPKCIYCHFGSRLLEESTCF